MQERSICLVSMALADAANQSNKMQGSNKE